PPQVEPFTPIINEADMATAPYPGPAPEPPPGSLSAPILAIEASPDTPHDSALSTQPAVESDAPNASPRYRPEPIPPTGPLGALNFDELTPPSVKARLGVVPPTSELDMVDPRTDYDEEPTITGGLTALPDPKTDLEAQSGIRFTGVQNGFESDPDLASVEAQAGAGKKSSRRLRIAASLLPFLVLVSGVVGYFLADDLGLGAERDKARAIAANHASGAVRTLRDSYHATVDQVTEISNEGRMVKLQLEPKDAALIRSTDTGDVVGPTSTTTTPKPPKNVENQEKPIAQERVSLSSKAASADDPRIALLGRPLVNKNEKSAKSPSLSIRSPRFTLPRPAPRQTIPATLPIAPPVKQTQIPSSTLDGAALLSSLRVSARAGNPRSQHDLARRLIQGDGIKQDLAEGSEWFREAAIQGASNAQYNLAVLYERGLGVTKDDVRALLWYHAAAEQLHPLAQYNLGIFYLQGRGIPLSYVEAAGWFKAASNQGVARATYNLAVLTEDGLGVPKDMKKALALYEKASSSGHDKATNRLVLLRDTGVLDTARATFEETADTYAEVGSTGTTVANIQSFLRISGIYEGRLDGIVGPKTRAAIREYQRRDGLPITGIPSKVLLDFMEISLGAKPSALD
ncbi:MAG: SEL1-like repeat protein, partial [Alphaproteobacteria bacterium]|nr:SEL1-like repeat protein [Alphaproteobacteria bacterium]